MKQIKVLMVAGSMNVGGIENQLMHLARNADKNIFQIDFTSTMEGAFYQSEIEELRGNFILIPDMDWRRPFQYIKTMYHVMKKGNYDVVHSHELFHSGITLMIAKIAGVPIRIAHAHNWKDDDGTGKKRSVVRSVYNVIMRYLILRYSTVQIACSSWAGSFLFGEKMLNKPSYHLVYNSVDTKKFLDNYEKKESGEWCEENGWKQVINVARVSRVKNQIFLVKIADELKKRNEKICILCVGSGDAEDVEMVTQMISKLGVESYIKMIGVRSDVDVLMRKSSAFILPSKYEGMPLVLIEAQASGLPCVVANTFSKEVDFGLNRIKWLELDSVKEWTEAIIDAINMGKAEKCDVEKAVQECGFDSRFFAHKICDIYQLEYNAIRK